MKTSLELVVSIDWLAARMDDPDLVVVDVRPADQYAAGHIPGARHLDLYPYKILDSDPNQIEAWVRALEAAFRNLGIRHDAQTVFYEDVSGATAARAVWLMHALQIGEGAMLDGGLIAWSRAGCPLSTEPVSNEPSDITATLDPASFATAADVLAAGQAASGIAIIDTRGATEWAQGTIPSARRLEWVHHLEPDGTLKPADELRLLYDTFGLDPDDQAITFCASGYRAAHTWLVLKLLGHERVSNYAPSWGEWGRHPELPIEPTR
jgi:thiosulfate/3-mercaptopyruvate sulfurtransferase